MKVRKAIIGAALVVGMIAGGLMLWPDSTSANAGPHGGYDLTTSGCAGCHRAHTAPAEELLMAATVYGLCTTCHGGGGIAQTDVENGRRRGDGARLNGGGFVQVGGKATTSTHTVDGLAGYNPDDLAWGGASSGVGVAGHLECTSCHNPHGSTNYRILKDSKNGYPYQGLTGWPERHRWVSSDANLLDWADNQVLSTVNDVPQNYASGNSANYTSGIAYNSTTRVTTYNQIPIAEGATQMAYPGMSGFCATCHKQYLTKSGSGGNPSTDAAYYMYPGTQNARDGKGDVARYRHAVTRTYSGTPDQPLRFASVSQNSADPVSSPTYTGFQCLTCHFAHGTSAAATGSAAGIAPTNDSALLYYDNRGVCRSCHQRDK